MVDVEEAKDPAEVDRWLDAMVVKPLAEHGWRDGVNVRIARHLIPMKSDWDETHARAAREVAAAKYDGAIVEGEVLTRRIRDAAPTLPIVAYLFDPVAHGFAQSVSKPGGTVTGCHRGVREIYLKHVEILRRLVPGTTRIGWISFRPQLQVGWPAFAWAAKEAGVAVRQVFIDTSRGFEYPGLAQDIAALARDGYRCAHFHTGLEQSTRAVSALALKHRIALSFWGPPQDFDREGLLLQYRSLRDGVQDRLAAAMAKILRGQHPRDIPFEGPTRYEMRIHLKTADLLGLKVPNDLMVMADELLR
jgi:putative ABC transport system substrate-binding protein